MARERGTVMITGASSGIGLATARLLAGDGYSVIATSRSIDRLEGLRQEAEEQGLPIRTVELDINSDASVEEVMPGLVRDAGGIDALVNNAGYGLRGPLHSVSTEEIRAQFETNVFAALRLTRAVLPGMVEKGKGTVVNVGSVVGRIGMPLSGAYSASKFALEGMSESMRMELWPLGVRVAIVEPGLFKTSFLENQVSSEQAGSDALPHGGKEARGGERKEYGRLGGDPVKVARVIRKIIRSRRPAFRYVVGPDARAAVVAKWLLPERLYLSLLSLATLR